jgi:hypothetical protein
MTGALLRIMTAKCSISGKYVGIKSSKFRIT